MNLLCAADVFGITPEFIKLCQEIAHQYCISVNISDDETCLQVIGPYEDSTTTFTNEQQAYEYFSQEVGLNHYALRLKNQLDLLAEPTIFIGFSVGGSAFWQHSAELNNLHIVKAVCIYSSQIRHNINIIPSVPVTLVLPTFEPHFCVEDMTETLLKTQNVSIVKSKYLHGFMNALSLNYDAKGAREYCSFVIS